MILIKIAIFTKCEISEKSEKSENRNYAPPSLKFIDCVILFPRNGCLLILFLSFEFPDQLTIGGKGCRAYKYMFLGGLTIQG